MPLNTYNDAVGPMAKSVREVALALDLVTGSDPEDPVTAEAARHLSGSFASGLDAANLKGRRIGVFRQRFAGFTGEREVAANMERVIKEMQSAGAIVVDVAIPDYDAKYAAARGAAPGSLARWLDGISGARSEARRQGPDDPGSAGVRQARARSAPDDSKARSRRRRRERRSMRPPGASSADVKPSDSCLST